MAKSQLLTAYRLREAEPQPREGGRLRILYVEPIADSQGHEGEYTAQLCQSLAKAGHHVTLCTNRIAPENFLREEPLFQIVEAGGGRLEFERYAREQKQRPLAYGYAFLRNSLVVLLRALQLLRQQPFDAMYIIDTDRVLMTLLLKLHRLRGGTLPPVVVEIHAANFDVREFRAGWLRRGWKWLQRTLLRNTLGREVQAIHALGEYHVGEFRQQLRLGEQFPVVAITEGIEVPEQLISPHEARRRLQLPDDGSLLFLMFGNIRKDKGVELVLEAMSRMESRRAQLVLVGKPVDYSEDELHALIRQHHVGDRVIPRFGYASEEEMFLYFQAADAAVFPYRGFYKGGTGPLRKACACRRPVVASNVAEMGRAVSLHRLGIVSAADDARSLAESLKAFVDLPDTERRSYAENAHRFARNNTWDAMAVRLVDLFSAVGAGPR